MGFLFHRLDILRAPRPDAVAPPPRQVERLEARRLLSAYSVIDLGTLGGATSEAYDINNSNRVVGHSRTAGGAVHAFRFTDANGNHVADPGEMVDLAPDLPFSYAYGVNAAGDAVGTSDANADPTDGDERAVRYAGGATVDLGLSNGSYAYGINGAGAIAGAASVGDDYLAFLRSPAGQVSTFVLPAPFNGYSEARAVNDVGTVAGYSSEISGTSASAFVRSPAGTLTPIAFPGASLPYSYAWDINAAGQVVGEGFNSAGAYHAFRYTNGGIADLGTLPGFGSSEAYGINAAGQVVGEAESVPAGGASHAFLYTDGAGMQDLNTLIPAGSGWVLTEARAINDNGYITGFGVSPSGQVHAFLLAPARAPTVTALSDSPDPATRSTITLTATASDPDNNVASVSFYRESNAAGGLQTGAGGDTLVATDTSSAGGWQVTFARGSLPPGTYTYYAEAADANGSTSAPGPAATTTNTVPLGGDVNLDERVDGSDFAILAGNFGKTGRNWSTGDFNDDGRVDGADFAILAGNFGKTAGVVAAAPVAASASAQASPEPAAKTSDPQPAKKRGQKAEPRRRIHRDGPLARRTLRAIAKRLPTLRR